MCQILIQKIGQSFRPFSIWDNKSTSKAALAVDEALAGLGLKRTQCMDADDPSGLKHKIMRYEVIIDNETQMTFFE